MSGARRARIASRRSRRQRCNPPKISATQVPAVCQRPSSLLFVLPAGRLAAPRRDPESHRPYAKHWRCAEPAVRTEARPELGQSSSGPRRVTLTRGARRKQREGARAFDRAGVAVWATKLAMEPSAHLLWSRRESATLSTGRHRACARKRTNKQTNKQTKHRSIARQFSDTRSSLHDERRRACSERRTWRSCIRRCRLLCARTCEAKRRRCGNRPVPVRTAT